jgi:MYXO-CTERM domain-containing protein
MFMFTRVSCASLIALVALISPASAAHRPDPLGGQKVSAGPARMQRTVDLRNVPPARARAAWARMTADLGPAQAIWDTTTGIPTRVWGAGLPAPGAVTTPGAAHRAAQDFLAAHLGLLAPGARLEDFTLAADHLSAGIRSVGFTQHYRGRPVVGGQVSLRYKHDRLALIASEALPHVSAVLTDSPIDPATARARALDSLRAEAPAAVAGAVSGPVILPLAGPRYREALAVVVDSERPHGRWTVWVDAATGEPLARESTLYSATGTIYYDIPERSPTFGERKKQPAAFLDLTVDGVGSSTDDLGAVGFAADMVSVGLGVKGDFVRIANADGSLASIDLPLMSGGEAVWSAPDDDNIDAQLTAFIAANAGKVYVRNIAEDLEWLKGQIKVTVNSKLGACNAMSDGNDLYFYQGEPEQCQNTARIPDVVYHELGHSVHSQSLIPGVGLFEGALSEGISDYLAATITSDPAVARGFFLGDGPLRDLDPDGKEWHWPEDTGEIHDEGRIIGGTLWDLRVALIAEMGEAEGIAHTDTIWYEATRRAMDIPTMYPEALLVDDDDGDLSNGSPHSCTIDQVFYAHGLVGALILGGEVRTLDAGGDGSVPVELDIAEAQSPCIDLAPTGARLEWRVRGAKDIAEMPMSEKTGGYAGALPPFPDGTVVQYRVVADLSDGNVARYPDNEAYPWYERYYGPVEPIYCTSFEGDPAADGWELFGEWEAGAPQGKSGDPAAAHDGSQVVGVDITEDGRYSKEKVANLRSPVIDIPEFPTVRLQYRRWLNVEDAFFDQATILADDKQVWQNFNSMMDDSSDVHHRDSEWSFHDVDITEQAADGSLQLTFRIASDAGLELGGWTIDSLCVVGTQQTAAPTCGDGVVAAPETCDDGNTAPGDGCAADCTLEPDADPTEGPTTGGQDPDPDTGSSGEPEDDPATAGQADDGSGCNCRHAGTGNVSSFALLILAALGRRRRARP